MGFKDGKITWVRSLKWHKYNVYGPVYEILTNESRLYITHDNPVLTFNGWLPSEKISRQSLVLCINLDIALGDTVIAAQTLGTLGNRYLKTTLWKEVRAIRELSKAEVRRIPKVYDFTTNSENFFANGILIKNCPVCSPSYTVKMDAYTPDLTPSTYGPTEGETVTGDTEAPIKILYHCPRCGYYSAALPVEVRLT